MSAPIVHQIISALNIIMGRDGTNNGKTNKQTKKKGISFYQK